MHRADVDYLALDDHMLSAAVPLAYVREQLMVLVKRPSALGARVVNWPFWRWQGEWRTCRLCNCWPKGSLRSVSRMAEVFRVLRVEALPANSPIPALPPDHYLPEHIRMLLANQLARNHR